uniref:CCHC-type domain-containing protein n=1 Tax=Cajanus cajan TaxID=3821 RepID=A0A151UEQ0_CAJCA
MFKCFECGKAGHIKDDYPYLRKQLNEETKSKFISKKKKAYIAGEDNASTTSNDSEQDQNANLCLMTRHDLDYEVSDSDSSSCSYNQIQDAFSELYDEAKKIENMNKAYKGKTRELELKVSFLEKENETFATEISKLKFPCIDCKKICMLH